MIFRQCVSLAPKKYKDEDDFDDKTDGDEKNDVRKRRMTEKMMRKRRMAKRMMMKMRRKRIKQGEG